MAILEKEIWVNIVSKNAKHYEELRYEIPRYVDKQGRLKVKKGTKILVNVDDLPNGNTEVTKICDDCGKHIPNQPYYAILVGRKNGDGKDRCFECGKKKARMKLLNNIKYENSLEYLAKINNKNYLITEYSDKNEKRPSEVAYKSGQEYIWNCSKCGSEYKTTAVSRTDLNSGCPFCAGYKVNHTNSLWTVKPEIAFMLKNKEIGHKVTSGSNSSQEFICPRCRYEQRKTVNYVTSQGFLPCNRCGDGISYSEKFMVDVLNQLSVEYEREKLFDWSEKRRYDFYIFPNCIIETHGLQHYTGSFESYGGKSFEEEKLNDEIKMKNAISNGINKYIIVDCCKSDMEYIKNSIVSSQLSELYNLNKIDWIRCHEFAFNSTMVRSICDLWNKGIKSSVEIGNIVKLERSAVVRYLKKAKNLGWCDYDPKEAQRQSGIRSGGLGKRSVIQLTLNDEFIKEWECAEDARRELKIYNISYVCTGRYGYKQAGGFKWLYKEDYLKKTQLVKQN